METAGTILREGSSRPAWEKRSCCGRSSISQGRKERHTCSAPFCDLLFDISRTSRVSMRPFILIAQLTHYRSAAHSVAERALCASLHLSSVALLSASLPLCFVESDVCVTTQPLLHCIPLTASYYRRWALLFYSIASLYCQAPCFSVAVRYHLAN